MAFKVINRDTVDQVDLNTLERSYDRLQQGHLNAVEQSSKLSNVLSQLDLNEQEEGFRQQQINKIKTSLNDNMLYGNAASSLDKVITESSNIMTSPEMLGRLRAQQEYKKYQNDLDKSNIPEDYKNYYREINKYEYKDNIDENGNVVKGGTWIPKDREVDTVPLNNLISQGIQWAAKEAGGGNRVRFLDENGNITNNPLESVTGEWFNDSNNKWERLTEDKIKSGVLAAIESTPGAKESLNQDYKIAKWKYDKNGENPDITDKNGTVLTPNQYLEKRLNPAYKAASYYNQFSNISYGDAVKTQRALSGSGESQLTPDKIDSIVTRGDLVSMANTSAADATSESVIAKQTISNLLKASNLPYIIDGKTDSEIKELVNNIQDSNLKNRAIVSLETYDRHQEYLNKLKEGKDPDHANAFDTYQAINNLTDLPDNEYSKEFNKLKGEFFNGNKAVRQYFKDDTFSAFMKQFDNDPTKLQELGIKIGTKDGKRYVELNNENSNSIYAFAKASKQAVDDTYGFWRRQGADWSKKFSSNPTKGGPSVTKIDEDGKESTFYGNLNQDDLQMNPIKNTVGNKAVLNNYTLPQMSYVKLLDFVDNKLKRKQDNIIENTTVEMGQSIIGQPSINSLDYAFQMKANPKGSADLNRVYTVTNNEIKRSLQKAGANQSGLVYRNEKTGKFEQTDTKTAFEIDNLLRSSKIDDIDVVTVYDEVYGKGWSPMITINEKLGDNKTKTHTFYIAG